MQENAVAYYIDFFVYPAVLFALLIYAALHVDLASFPSWFAAAIIGIALWTLVEYILHRFVLHNVVYFKTLHDSHHANPKALIDTPIWVSLSILAFVVMAPSYWALGPVRASGFTLGLTLGYLSYGVMHHGMHFWRFPHDSYFYRAKRRHALHHYSKVDGNFGVTSLFWDHVFGTALPDAGPGSDPVKD